MTADQIRLHVGASLKRWTIHGAVIAGQLLSTDQQAELIALNKWIFTHVGGEKMTIDGYSVSRIDPF